MQEQTDTKRDPEAVLLARVYALILTWGESEPETPRADAASNAIHSHARTPRKPKTGQQTEGKNNG